MRVKPRMSQLKTVHSSTSCAALLHLELAGDDLLGDVRRERGGVKRSRLTISCSIFFARMLFSMNIAAWFADGGDELEILLLELRERLASRARATPSTSLLVEERHDDGARDPVQDHALPLEAAKSIAASWVSTAARSLMTWFRIVEQTWMGASVPSRRCAARGCKRAVVLAEEDDAAIGVDELEERQQDLVEQLVEVALEADVARELPREAQALVVDAELLRVVRDLVEREEALRLRRDLRADRARGVEHVDARAAEARRSADARCGRGGWRRRACRGGARPRPAARGAAEARLGRAARGVHRRRGLRIGGARSAAAARSGACGCAAAAASAAAAAMAPAAAECGAVALAAAPMLRCGCCDGARARSAGGAKSSGPSRRRSERASSRARSRRRAGAASRRGRARR